MKEAVDILLIEDEPNIAEALRFILSREGWRIAVQDDGAGAITAIRAQRPRLIILDQMLPNRSGSEIMAQLRADPDPVLAATRVMLLTAQGRAVDTAMQAGADAAMSKPFDNDALRAMVQRLMGAA